MYVEFFQLTRFLHCRVVKSALDEKTVCIITRSLNPGQTTVLFSRITTDVTDAFSGSTE